MYTCIYIHINTIIHTCTHMHTYIYIFDRTMAWQRLILLGICVNICKYLFMYDNIYIYVHMCIKYIFMCARMYRTMACEGPGDSAARTQTEIMG